MTRPEAHNLVNDPLRTSTGAPDVPAVGRTAAENCARINDLGYVASKHITSKHITMYGERLELVSDPVEEGEYLVVQVISRSDPTIRRLQLPVSILLGLSDRGEQKTKFGKRHR